MPRLHLRRLSVVRQTRASLSPGAVSAASAVLLLACVTAGCSGQTGLPCSLVDRCPPPFVPTSTAPTPTVQPSSPQATTGHADDIVLVGKLNADKDLTTIVTSRLRSQPRKTAAGPQRTTDIGLSFAGSVTVTNTGTSINPAAVSVDIEIRAGFRAGSMVCRQLRPQPPVRRGLCWPTVATAAFQSAEPPVMPLAAGQASTAGLSSTTGTMTVPAGKTEQISRALVSPVVIVASTSEIQRHGPFGFRNVCTSNKPAPAAPGKPAGRVGVDHVILGSTRRITCDQIAW